jgi:hypothetical protein
MIMRTGARVVAAIVLLVVPLQLAACSKTVKPDVTANFVADFVQNNTQAKMRPTDVTCPSGIDAKVGTEFDCHFTGPDGKYTAHLKITKIDGEDVTYDIRTFRS